MRITQIRNATQIMPMLEKNSLLFQWLPENAFIWDLKEQPDLNSISLFHYVIFMN